MANNPAIAFLPTKDSAITERSASVNPLKAVLREFNVSLKGFIVPSALDVCITYVPKFFPVISSVPLSSVNMVLSAVPA